MNHPKPSNAPKHFRTRLVFSSSWEITLFFVVMLPILVSLGCWQMERAKEKQKMFEARMSASQQIPINITSLSESTAQSFLPVTAQGHFLPGKHILLDNQIMKGRAGYYVYSVLQLDNKNANLMIVNRGWVLAPADRSQVPVITDVPGKVVANGYLWRPGKPSFVLGNYIHTEQWPKIIQSVNFDDIQAILKQDVYPWTLVLNAGDNAEYPEAKYKMAMSSDKHTGYAVQWFCMALVLVIMYLYSSFKREVVR